MMPTEADSGHVARTLRTLELLAERPRSTAELADELSVHPRTVRRLMSRFITEGYAEGGEPEGREYRATVKVVALAGHVLSRTDLVRVATPYVARLRDLANESAHLSVPRSEAVIHLVREISQNAVVVVPRLGDLVPYHSTAVGKALLAFLPEQEARVGTQPMQRLTDHTIVGLADLLLEIATVRQSGYAVEDLENETTVRGAAAPILDHTSAAIGALGVVAPASRLHSEDLHRIGRTTADLAAELSAALGFSGTRISSPLTANSFDV
jgi:DNA-binding IclR family transcriptional regulator